MKNIDADPAIAAPGARRDAAELSGLYRSFWRKLDAALRPMGGRPDVLEMLDEIVRLLLRDFRRELAFAAGRIYERVEDRYVLRRWIGEHQPEKVGYTVPMTYPAVQALMDRGLVIIRETDPEYDRTIEDPLGVTVFAAMTLGDENRYLLSFSLEGEFDREKTLYLLSAIQHVVGQKLRQQYLLNIMEEARRIQVSLLPKACPPFHGYDIFGRSTPAESVSGDLFDFLPISDRILGVAVADSCGHGLPAALQARDVIIGLRMVSAENMKIVSTIERLNRVIHRSTLATRFVSLFYGELETSGNFFYCSAGHPPALFHHGGAFQELGRGGLVLGPDPDARYERGSVQIEPGDTIVIYTDGITEATDRLERAFGVERLKEAIARGAGQPARAVADLIFQQVEAFSGSTRPRDDQTVVVIRHPASGKEEIR